MKDQELQKLDFSSWPLPDAYLMEIGRVAVLWANLEAFLNLCLGKLAGFNELDDPKPFILVHHSSFPQRLDMLGSLCEHLAPEFPALNNSADVIGKLRSAQRSRNEYMHYSMSLNPDTEKVQSARGSARGSLNFKVQDIGLQDIRRACVNIHEAYQALYKLVLGRDIPAPWQKTS